MVPLGCKNRGSSTCLSSYPGSARRYGVGSSGAVDVLVPEVLVPLHADLVHGRSIGSEVCAFGYSRSGARPDLGLEIPRLSPQYGPADLDSWELKSDADLEERTDLVVS